MSCVFCGADASEKIVFPDTFTAYQLLQAGDKACARCAMMFRDAKYRRNCWVLQGEKWLKIEDALLFLASPNSWPSFPFILYFTLQKRKHGWILAVQNPVCSCDKFLLVVDEEKILFERNRFTELQSFSKALLERGVPKEIVKCLGIREGDKLIIEVPDDKTFIVKKEA